MGKIALWRVVWGIALLTGLAWPTERGAERSRTPSACADPVVFAGVDGQRLLCEKGAVRAVVAGCRLRRPIVAGVRLTVEREKDRCVIHQAVLPGATRIRMGLALDVNHASPATLTAIDGIGDVTATKIVAGRPYARIEDLRRVKGIGPKRLARLRTSLTVRPARQVWPPTPPFAPRAASIRRGP